MLTPSPAFFHVADVVAGSHTLTDVISGSSSVKILSTIPQCVDGTLVAAGSGSLSAVGSGMRSTQRGDGGLGTGSGVELSEIRSRAIPGRRSAHDVQAGIVECTGRVIHVVGEDGEDQEQSGVALRAISPPAPARESMGKHNENKNTKRKNGKQKQRGDTEVTVSVGSSVTNCADAGTRRSQGNVSQSLIKELRRQSTTGDAHTHVLTRKPNKQEPNGLGLKNTRQSGKNETHLDSN